MSYHIKPQTGDSLAVPQLVLSHLPNTTEANIRVALYVLATGITDPIQIAEKLKLRSHHTAETALLYWAGAGLLEQVEDTPAPLAPPPKLTWIEIEQSARTDPMVAALVQTAQQCFGQSIGRDTMQKVVSLYLQDGYHPEVVLLCLTYLSARGKATLAQLRHELKAWQAEGVTTGDEADRYTRLLEKREQREAFVAQLLQVDITSLTQGGRKAIARWFEQYGFDEDMITEAAVQAGPKRDLWYWNKILHTWHEQGLHTVHDVRGSGTSQSTVSRNIRVDRTTPSGNDPLTMLSDRPRRLKRKD